MQAMCAIYPIHNKLHHIHRTDMTYVAHITDMTYRTHRMYIHTYLIAQNVTYIQAFIHTRMHVYIHTYMHACMHAYMHTCIHAYMHTCIHAYMHTCIHAYMHTCMQAGQTNSRITRRPYIIQSYRPTYLPAGRPTDSHRNTRPCIHTDLPTYRQAGTQAGTQAGRQRDKHANTRSYSHTVSIPTYLSTFTSQHAQMHACLVALIQHNITSWSPGLHRPCFESMPPQRQGRRVSARHQRQTKGNSEEARQGL